MYYQKCHGTEINNYPGKHTQITRDIAAVQFVDNSKILQTMYQKFNNKNIEFTHLILIKQLSSINELIMNNHEYVIVKIT